MQSDTGECKRWPILPFSEGISMGFTSGMSCELGLGVVAFGWEKVSLESLGGRRNSNRNDLEKPELACRKSEGHTSPCKTGSGAEFMTTETGKKEWGEKNQGDFQMFSNNGCWNVFLNSKAEIIGFPGQREKM